MLWSWPTINETLISIGADKITIHYCCWLNLKETPTGRPWLKPTTLAGTLPGLASLGRRKSMVGARGGLPGAVPG